MRFAILFEDDPAKSDQRQRHMEAHLGFLEANAERIHAAGPLSETVSGEAAGGLWLVDAEDADSVRALVEADPFWPTGLRKSVRILAWTRVFHEGVRQI